MSCIQIYDMGNVPIECLRQWDSNQRIRISGIDVEHVTNVHFCHTNSTDALVVIPEKSDIEIIVNVPNILLQVPKPIVVHIFQDSDIFGQRTIASKRINVAPRAKPCDYIYTETEVLSYRELDKRLTALENDDGDSSSSTTVVRVTRDDYGWSTDKPFEELRKHIDSGSILWCCIERSGMVDVLPLTNHDDSSVMFGGIRGTTVVSVTAREDSTTVFEEQIALHEQLSNIGSDMIEINQSIGDLGSLETEDKVSLVAAINEVLRLGGKSLDEDAIERIIGEYLSENPPEDGEDGKSAYQYAVEGGYVGTEEEFSEDLARECRIHVGDEPPTDGSDTWLDTGDDGPAYLPSPAKAEVGQYLRVTEVDADGKIVATETVGTDTSFSVSGAPADALVTGNNIKNIGKTLNAIEKTSRYMTTSEWALSIDSVGMTVTVPAGMLACNNWCMALAEQTVDILQDDATTLVVYDSSADAVRSVRFPDHTGKTMYVIAVITRDRYANPNANWVQGPYLVDGVMVGGADVEGCIPTPSTAQAGQTIVVKEVDEYGKPVSWECADLPAGGNGGEQWELIRKEMTITEEFVSVTFNTDDNGDPFSLKRMRIYMYLPPETDSTAYADYRINGEGSYTNPSGGWSNIRLMGDIETMGDEKTITITWYVLPTAWTAASTQRVRYIWSSSKFNTIRSFKWALFARNVMPNTTFEIWGVRA